MNDAMQGVVKVWSDGGSPAWWPHLLLLDPAEQEKIRRHQIIALARYGRQPISEWLDADVQELRAWYESLAELMKAEAEATRHHEDG